MTNLKKLYHDKWVLARMINYYEAPDKKQRRIARNERRRIRQQVAGLSRQPDPREPRLRADKRYRKTPVVTWRLTWEPVRSKNNPTSKAVHYEARKVQA